MPKAIAVVIVFTVCVAGQSCIRHRPVRTFDDLQFSSSLPHPHCAPLPAVPGTVPSVPVSIDTSIGQLQQPGPAGNAHRNAVSCVAQEDHVPQTDTQTSLPHAGFTLHVLEFDDEGRPWNLDRQVTTMDTLRRQIQKPSVVVAFVHGWKNDASKCNGNLACFREVLEILAKAEMQFASPGGTPRQVIGVYIGWRGGITNWPGVKELTFWSRKHTAHVIGDNGGVTAVIERLRTMVEEVRCPASARVAARNSTIRVCPQPKPFETTSLVFVGHSFGAALLYSAVATSLNGSVGAAIEQAMARSAPLSPLHPTPQRQRASARPLSVPDAPVLIPSGGDLIVLVNPAMEASRFANLNAVRNLVFDERQVPLFLTLASEEDGAVGSFFPIGQAFATLFRAARTRDVWFSMVKGFGLYAPFHTHRLVLKPVPDAPLPEERKGTCRCPDNLGAFGDALVLRLKQLHDAIKTQPPPAAGSLRLAAYQEMRYSRLEPIRDTHPHNPFIMATVDPAIVSGHSDIFNARFVDFLIEYVIRSEIKRGLVGDYATGVGR